MELPRFRDRSEAGRLLADVDQLALERYGLDAVLVGCTAEWEAGEVPETFPFGV